VLHPELKIYLFREYNMKLKPTFSTFLIVKKYAKFQTVSNRMLVCDDYNLRLQNSLYLSHKTKVPFLSHHIYKSSFFFHLSSSNLIHWTHLIFATPSMIMIIIIIIINLLFIFTINEPLITHGQLVFTLSFGHGYCY